MTLDNLFPLLQSEVAFGFDKYGKFSSAHEQYAVLQEEVDEWWDAVKSNTSEDSQYELLQVAAVALRYILENGDFNTISRAHASRHKRGA